MLGGRIPHAEHPDHRRPGPRPRPVRGHAPAARGGAGGAWRSTACSGRRRAGRRRRSPFACSAMDGYAILAGPAGRRLTLVGESRAGTPTTASGDGQADPDLHRRGPPPGRLRGHPPGAGHARRGRLGSRPAPTSRRGSTSGGPGEDMAAGHHRPARRHPAGPGRARRRRGRGRRPASASHARPGSRCWPPGMSSSRPVSRCGPGRDPQLQRPDAERRWPVMPAPDPRPPSSCPTSGRPRASGIEAALDSSDLVIISGGVSVGPHDHVKPALAALGVTGRSSGAWPCNPASRPGSAVLDDEGLVFGLPGNPVSAVVTFSLFVLPALRRAPGPYRGAAGSRPRRCSARMSSAIRGASRRSASSCERGPGPTTAVPNGAQGSHILTSLLGADALAMIPAGEGVLPAGSQCRPRRAGRVKRLAPASDRPPLRLVRSQSSP